MKGQVTRRRAGVKRRRRKIVCTSFPALGQGDDHDLIDPLVTYERETIRRVDVDRMGVGAALVLGMHARPHVLSHVAGRPQTAVGPRWIGRDRPVFVIHDDDGRAGWVHGNVARIAAVRGSTIEKGRAPVAGSIANALTPPPVVPSPSLLSFTAYK